MYEVRITTFGYLHGTPPEAHITLNLRKHFKDPHANPGLRYLTAHDAEVRKAVLATPGIATVVEATALTVEAYMLGPPTGPSTSPVSLAVGCAAGRHIAAAVGIEIAAVLQDLGHGPITLVHRDLHKRSSSDDAHPAVP